MFGRDFKKAIPHDVVEFYVAVLGAGASAPTVPTDGKLIPAGAGVFPVRANKVSRVTAEAPTRTSAGLYVITYADPVLQVIHGACCVVSDGASPTTALRADVTIFDPVNRKITVLVTVPTTGTATDIGTSDLLIVKLQGLDQSA